MPKEKKGNILDIINKREILSVIWSSSTAYTSGQYVVYGNYFYKCIKNATAGTVPTNTTYWEKTNLASEITTLNSNLTTFIKRTNIVVSPRGTFSSLVQEGDQWVFIIVSNDNVICIFTAQKNDGEITITNIQKPSNYEIGAYKNGTIDVAYNTTSTYCRGIAFRMA